MKPRVWFGTMYSGENEFADCCHAISQQEGLAHVQQHVIRGLKEAEAHNALWTAWDAAKPKFDLFVKVDADTVLDRPTVVTEVWQLFESDTRVTGVQVRLHDFMTDKMISGLNFFSPRVAFTKSNGLWCDRVDTNHDVVLKGQAVVRFEPAGRHSPDPSEMQAFHFGLHRALKGQLQVVKDVYAAYRREPEKTARCIALLGAIAASCVSELRAGFDYTDEQFQRTFQTMMGLEKSAADQMVEEYAGPLGWR